MDGSAPHVTHLLHVTSEFLSSAHTHMQQPIFGPFKNIYFFLYLFLDVCVCVCEEKGAEKSGTEAVK